MRPVRLRNSTLEIVTWQMRVRAKGSDIPRRGEPQCLPAVTIVETVLWIWFDDGSGWLCSNEEIEDCLHDNLYGRLHLQLVFNLFSIST